MNKIEDFKLELDMHKFTWNYNGEMKEKQFLHKIDICIELLDKSGFAIVGSLEEFGKSNAMLMNADGTIRAQLRIPESLRDSICFYQIYYVNQELTGIIACRYGSDFSCTIDEKTGECSNIHETR